MKLMTGREYLSKIRRKASESPWHTRVTRSAELFIRVPAKALIVALGRLVMREGQRFQIGAGAVCRSTFSCSCILLLLLAAAPAPNSVFPWGPRSCLQSRRRRRRTVRRDRACPGRCDRESFDFAR